MFKNIFRRLKPITPTDSLGRSWKRILIKNGAVRMSCEIVSTIEAVDNGVVTIRTVGPNLDMRNSLIVGNTLTVVVPFDIELNT